MAESTLAVAYQDLQQDVAFFLGWGRGLAAGDVAWTTQQQQAIDRCLKGGLRNFYHCGYNWSFLRPVLSITLANGASLVALPDDFGGYEGQITVSTTAGIQWWPVEFGSVDDVNRRSAMYPTATGRPQVCCLEPIKGTGAAAGQRFQLRFWPIADTAYTLKFQYYVNPDYLSGTFPYAYGGAQHAETLLESCLAVAEKILDGEATLHDTEFQKKLALSQQMDRRQKPYNLGYNGDRSDQKAAGGDLWRPLNPITISGNTPL